MKHIAGMMMVVVFALAASSNVFSQAAQNHLDNILANKKLRVGTTGDFKPFSYFDAGGGRFEGLDIDLAENLAKSLGAELTLVQTSWPTLEDDLLAGKFDIAMSGVSVTLGRQKHADFSDAYLTDGKAAIARCGDVEKYKTLAGIDQPGVRVIVNPGGTNEQFARAVLKQAKLIIFADNVTIFDEIVAAKADVMITDASETRFQQKLHSGILCAVSPDRPFSFAEKAFLLPRDPIWKAYVNQWLRQTTMTGQLNSIMARWLGGAP